MIRKFVFTILTVILLLYGMTWVPWMIATVRADIRHEVNDVPRSEAVIVFGGLYYTDQPMTETNAERLLTAKALWEAGKVETIVISNSRVAALGMQAYLVERGVPESVIELDDQAIVTEDTCKAEGRKYPEGRDVIFVSHGYHLPRIDYLCRMAGVYGVGFPAEELELVDRVDVPFFEKMRIRFERQQREAYLVLLRMVGVTAQTI